MWGEGADFENDGGCMMLGVVVVGWAAYQTEDPLNLFYALVNRSLKFFCIFIYLLFIFVQF